jgi:ATP adenylyltransferase
MERLWAPWRQEYVGKAAEGEDGCILCDKPAEGKDEENYILARTDLSFAILNAYPYNSGHLMVAPFRHEGEFSKLKDDELLDLQQLMQRCIRALGEAMNPAGYNLGMNLGSVAGAGIPDHLHWHVVPRWNGDTNFMPVLGETKVLPELVRRSFAKLRAYVGKAT